MNACQGSSVGQRPGRFIAAVVILVACLTAGTAWSQARGLTIRLKATESPGAPPAGEVELYRSSHALIIGIDDYTGGWLRLSKAVEDAELIAAELRKRGFEVTLKTNLVSAELERAFKEFFILKGQDPAARLFVWFAGHGHSIEGEGYLVPADAPPPETGARFKLKALNMRRFGEFVREAESKHAFAVFDACFAGTIFTTQRSRPPAAITRATTMPVRQFLTSGDAGQTVSDDGTFRKLFLRALRGEERADANQDGYVTATEMGLYLTDRMTNLTETRQTPRYGKLRDPDYDRGDFVFAQPGEASRPTAGMATPARRPDKETVFWQSIQGGMRASDYDAYLKQFPNGTFVALAVVRLKELQGRRTPAPMPRMPGYVVQPMDGEYVALGTANVRAEPGTAGAKVGLLRQGSKVTVTGRVLLAGATWYRVAGIGRTLELAFSVAGRIEKVIAKSATSVGEGQLLARLYSPEIHAASAAAEAGVSTAKAALASQTRRHGQLRKLFEQQVVAQRTVDESAGALAEARRQLAQAESRIAAARPAAAGTELTSPITGTVVERNVEPGMYVRAGAPAFVVREGSAAEGYVFGSLLKEAAVLASP